MSTDRKSVHYEVRKMNQKELIEVLQKHKLWLDGAEGGVRADLREANLYGSNLSGAYLSGANLSGAYLNGADLNGANLYGSNLSGASLNGADLNGANLYGSNLSGANLYESNLNGANLRGSNLSGASLNGANLRGADLRHCIGNNLQIKIFQLPYWSVVMTKDDIAIGCQQHQVDAWWAFSDDEIANMDVRALEWWKLWKLTIQQIHAGSFSENE